MRCVGHKQTHTKSIFYFSLIANTFIIMLMFFLRVAGAFTRLKICAESNGR